MSQRTITTCNCGCRVSDEKQGIRWFTLRQAEKNWNVPGANVEILENPLHFASFDCLGKWASKARTTARKMEAFLKSEEYEGRYFDGYYVGGGETMRTLIVPTR